MTLIVTLRNTVLHFSKLFLVFLLLFFHSLETNAQTISISGKLELPSDYVLTENIEITLQAASGRVIVPIAVGENDADFVIDGLEQGVSEEYKISYYCSCTESFIRTGTFGLNGVVRYSTDPEALVFLGDQNHSGVRLQIDRGQSISGSLSLPEVLQGLNTQQLMGNVTVGLTVDEGGAYNSVAEKAFVLNPMEDSVDYQIDFLPRFSNRKFIFKYSCNGCGGVILVAYLGSDKMSPIADQAKRYDATVSHENLNLTLVPESKLSAVIKIPDEFHFNGNARYQITALSVSSEWFTFEGPAYAQSIREFLDIPAGTDEYPFEISGIFPTEGELSLKYVALSNTDPAYYSEGYYSDSGTVLLEEEQTLLSALSDNTGIEFDLIRKNEISGTIETADGLPVDFTTSFSVYVDIYKNGEDLRVTGYSRTARMLEGQSSVDYLIPGVDSFDDDHYAIVSFSHGNHKYFSNGYFSNDGTLDTADDATKLPVDSSLTGINMQVRSIVLNKISGTVNLPEEFTTDQDVYVNFDIESLLIGEVVIKAGERSADFEINDLTLPANENYALIVSVNSDSPINLIETALYSSTGLVRTYAEATLLPGEQDHVGLDFSLVEGSTVEGVIGIEGNFLPDFLPGGYVEVWSFDVNGQLIDRQTGSFQINENGSPVDYKVLGLWSEPNGYYNVGYNCNLNCQLYERSAWLTNSGMTLDSGESTHIPVQDDELVANLTILEKHTNITKGTVLWEHDFISSNNTTVSLVFDIYPPTGPSERVMKEVSVPAGSNNSAEFEVRLPTPEAGGELFISYYCRSCSGGVRDRYYYQNIDSYTFDEQQQVPLIASNDHDVNLFMSRGSIIAGKLVAPSRIDAFGEVSGNVFVKLYDQFGVQQHEYFLNVSVPEGEFSIPFEVSGLTTLPGGYYVLGYQADWARLVGNVPPDEADISDTEFTSVTGYYLSNNTTVDEPRFALRLSADFFTETNGLNVVIDSAIDPNGEESEIVTLDNCPFRFNPFQEDLDSDQIGDLCDPDMDGDGVNDIDDPEPRNKFICGDQDLDEIDDCYVEANFCFPIIMSKDAPNSKVSIICL